MFYEHISSINSLLINTYFSIYYIHAQKHPQKNKLQKAQQIYRYPYKSDLP